MTLLLKAPDALLDYAVDWSAEYLSEDALAESRWSVDPDETGGLLVNGDSFDFGTASVQVAEGEAGKVYRLTNHVRTVAGLEDSRSITVRVEAR